MLFDFALCLFLIFETYPDKFDYCEYLILIKCSLFKIFASMLSKRGWLKSEIDAKMAAELSKLFVIEFKA